MEPPDVRQYFDEKAVSRDDEFRREPILGFEQRMRRKVLFDLLGIKPGETVLDAGCGNLSDYEAMEAAGGAFFGMDLSEGMVREGRKKHPESAGRIILGDALAFPFLPGSLDKISMSEIIEHIPDYETAIRQAARCLKPGGRLVVTCPNRKSLYGLARKLWERKAPWEHPYDEWKTGKEIAASFKKAGLKANSTRGAVYLPTIYGRHIPKKIQKLMVFFGSLAEPLFRRLLPSFGYIIAVRGDREKP